MILRACDWNTGLVSAHNNSYSTADIGPSYPKFLAIIFSSAMAERQPIGRLSRRYKLVVGGVYELERIAAKMTQLFSQSDQTTPASANSMSNTQQKFSSSAVREEFTKQAQSEQSILEIGPFFSPCVKGANVFYFDVLDTAGLIKRAEVHGRDASKIPHIDYVSENGDLSVVNRRFNAIISAHCIEHQPDLIRHIRQVSNLLSEGGRYYLIIPDKRYCFDHFIPETTLDEVINAQGLTRHSLMKVIEHRALTTHNNPARHWRGDHLDSNYYDSILRRTKTAIAEFESASGNYIDVHSWQFTPNVLIELISSLQSQKLIEMAVASINETPPNRFEFTAILEKV